MKYTDDQKEFFIGVKDYLENDFPRKEYIALQGKPGSGKTFCITQLEKEFGDTNFIYVAYTGKAVDNLMKKGVDARTIYSTFYRVKKDTDNLEFELLEEGPRCDVVVIDEVSMVPQRMFEEILSFGNKVIAVGDRNQLGPVKEDLNHILDFPDYELQTIHRQEEDSGIIRLANEYVRTHKFPEYGQYSDDVLVIPIDKVTVEMILSVNQTICGMNSTREKWNSIIRKAYQHYDYFPEVNERVICCRNTPIYVGSRRVINGTTGTVTGIKLKGNNQLLMTFKPDWADEEVTLKVNGENFINNKFEVSTSREACFDFAYVITVNKAQGSEWDSVLFIVDKEIPGDSFFRNVNTGITRASKKLILAY